MQVHSVCVCPQQARWEPECEQGQGRCSEILHLGIHLAFMGMPHQAPVHYIGVHCSNTHRVNVLAGMAWLAGCVVWCDMYVPAYDMLVVMPFCMNRCVTAR